MARQLGMVLAHLLDGARDRAGDVDPCPLGIRSDASVAAAEPDRGRQFLGEEVDLLLRALDAARPGTVVEIVSDNLSSVETIPFMLAGHGCVHLGTLHLDGFWKIYARKLGADEGEKGQ